MPNDESEKDRLDIMHELMLTMMDRNLFLAPISSSPNRVLDLGTGTGVWAIDFGKSFINFMICFVMGADDKPEYQPTSTLVQR